VAHIEVPPGVPGIGSLFVYHPATALPMCDLCEVVLRGPSPLTAGERELIATRVSRGNECVFCTTAHASTAAHLLGGDHKLVADVSEHYETAAVSPKLKALLAIADKVRRDARTVSPRDVEAARREGATDDDIHDTVLVAAMFCMFNKYVDGLGAWTPKEEAPYEELGKRLAKHGYTTIPGIHVPDPNLKPPGSGASAEAPP
jgi:uncharacterized peroxidase-related enzyme